MPITSCPDCNGKVSTTAPTCPHCGRVMGSGGSPGAAPPPPQPAGSRFCPSCGNAVVAQAVICVNCGVALPGAPMMVSTATNSKLVCALFAFLLPFGIHRFIMGYQTEGIIQLILGFGCIGWIWCWIDGIMILTGSLKMKDGTPLL